MDEVPVPVVVAYCMGTRYDDISQFQMFHHMTLSTTVWIVVAVSAPTADFANFHPTPTHRLNPLSFQHFVELIGRENCNGVEQYAAICDSTVHALPPLWTMEFFNVYKQEN